MDVIISRDVKIEYSARVGGDATHEVKESLDRNRKRLKVDEAGRTFEPWLWVADHMVRGTDVVSAVADSHRVAVSTDQFLSMREAAA